MSIINDLWCYLIPYLLNVTFLHPLNKQGFLMFSGVLKVERWVDMGQRNRLRGINYCMAVMNWPGSPFSFCNFYFLFRMTSFFST